MKYIIIASVLLISCNKERDWVCTETSPKGTTQSVKVHMTKKQIRDYEKENSYNFGSDWAKITCK